MIEWDWRALEKKRVEKFKQKAMCNINQYIVVAKTDSFGYI